MFKAIAPGTIGIQPRDLDEAIEAAKAGGFKGLEIDPRQIGADAREKLEAASLRAAGFGLPVEFRGEDGIFQEGLKSLPKLADAAVSAGATRCYTWIMPCSNSRPLKENRMFHVERLRHVARILADKGCRLGLEFIGPRTLRESQKYPFIFTMGDMLEMAKETGDNVGLLVDSYHLYTSHGTLAELGRLTAQDVVYVHVNDAPAGVAVDEQLDTVRCLPAETGAIDIGGFLKALLKLGYDGPVVPEPFSRRLNELPSNADRARAAGRAMDVAFGLAGL